MNQRLRELMIEAGYAAPELAERAIKLAGLIVRECIDCLKPLSRNHSIVGAAQDTIKEHFEDDEPKGWVCPKCGIDRTRQSCPQGTMAAVEGRCPMIGVAQ